MPINVTHGSGRQTGLNIPYKYQRPHKRTEPRLGIADVLQQQQLRNAEKLFDMKYKAALLRQRDQQLWAEAPELVDPAANAAEQARLAGQRFGSGDVGQQAAALTARQMQAKQRANARALRMGKAIPHPDAMPEMTAGVTRTEAHADRQMQQRRGFELEDAVRRRAEDIEDQDLQFRRAELDEYIPPIPKHLEGTEHERDLRRLNEAERALRSERDFDQEDPEIKSRIKKIRKQRAKKLAEAGPEPDPAEGFNKRVRVWDQGLGQLVPPAPGERPDFFLDDNDMPVPFPESPREQEDALEKEKKTQEEKERKDDLRNYMRELEKERRSALFDGNVPNQAKANALATEIDGIRQQLTGAADPAGLWQPSSAIAGGGGGVGAPVMPAAGGGAPPVTTTGGTGAAPPAAATGKAGPAPASTSNNYRWDGSKWVKVK